MLMHNSIFTPRINQTTLIKDTDDREWPHQFVRDWWLRSLWAKFGKFTIAYSWGKGKYSTWVDYYPGIFVDKDCVEREVLRNELLFDFDHDDYKQNVIGAKLLIKRLMNEGLSYYCFFSGNKGFHISVFFDKELIKVKHPRLIAKALEHKISFKDVLAVYYNELMGDLYCSDFVDTPLMEKKRHLIRSVGSINYKSGQFKTFIVDPTYGKPSLLKFPYVSCGFLDIKTNYLSCFSRIVNSLIQSKQSTEVKVDPSAQSMLSRFFIKDKKKSKIDLFKFKLVDGRQRFVTFVLMPSLVLEGFSKVQAIAKLKSWFVFIGYSGKGLDLGYLYDYCKRKRSYVNYSLIKEFRRLGYLK